MIPQKEILTELESLVQEADSIIKTYKPNPENVQGFPTLSSDGFILWQNKCIDYLSAILGNTNVTVRKFQHEVRSGYRGQVESGKRILKSVLEDIRNDYYTKY